MEHFTTCKKVTGYTTIHRHDEMIASFASVLREHQIMTSPVPVGYNEDDGRRPDLVVWLSQGTYCLDFSVVLPTATSYVQHSVQDHHYAVKLRERQKQDKHGPSAVANGHHFVPMVFDAFGGKGPAAEYFFQVLENAKEGGTRLCRKLHRAVGAALQRGNCRILKFAGRQVHPVDAVMQGRSGVVPRD